MHTNDYFGTFVSVTMYLNKNSECQLLNNIKK